MDQGNILETKVAAKTKNLKDTACYREYLREHPRLTYLFIELTDACNMHCLHCGSNCGDHKNFIDTELLLSALKTVAEDFIPKTVMICFTGGEPLLHPDFFNIVEKAVEYGFSWGITTNGSLIDTKIADKLKEQKLQTLTLSIDGLEASHDRFRGAKGSFRKTLRAITILKKTRIPVQITTVVHRQNFSELESLYRFVCSTGAFSWRVINIEPIGRALQHNELSLTKQQMLQLLGFIREKRFSAQTPIDVVFGCSHYLSYEYEHEVRDQYFLCGAGLYAASILCNGDIYACLDIERREELVQGNIKTDRFSNVWFSRFQLFRTDRTQLCRQCADCDEREFCAGDSTHTWDFESNQPRFCVKNL